MTSGFIIYYKASDCWILAALYEVRRPFQKLHSLKIDGCGIFKMVSAKVASLDDHRSLSSPRQGRTSVML